MRLDPDTQEALAAIAGTLGVSRSAALRSAILLTHRLAPLLKLPPQLERIEAALQSISLALSGTGPGGGTEPHSLTARGAQDQRKPGPTAAPSRTGLVLDMAEAASTPDDPMGHPNT